MNEQQESMVWWVIAICLCLSIGSCTANKIYQEWQPAGRNNKGEK